MRQTLHFCTLLFAFFMLTWTAVGQVRPTVETASGIDTRCFTITVNGDSATGTFAWRKTVDTNGREQWVCAGPSTPLPPQLSISSTPVWTSATSEKQSQYIREQVIAAIQAAVKDSIVTKDQVKKLVDDRLAELVKAEVTEQLNKRLGNSKQ